MRIDKNKIKDEELQQPIKVDIEDAEDPDGLLAQKIAEDIKNGTFSLDEESNNVEYEYVDVKDATSGIVGKIKEIVDEYRIIVISLVLIAVGSLLSVFAQNATSVFFAIAFGIISAIGIVLIYFAWQDKKKAERELQHAIDVIEPVKRKMKETASDNKNDK